MYSAGVSLAGPFLNILSSPSSITILCPVSRLDGTKTDLSFGPRSIVGEPGLLSIGPGVLIPNTLLGISLLALLLVSPLKSSSSNPASVSTLTKS